MIDTSQLNLDDPEAGLKEKDPFWGVLGVDEAETDYQLLAGVLDLPKPKQTFYDYKYQYHQPNVSSVSCTVASATGCVSDLTGVEFTLAQQKEMWAEALRRGAREGWGWYIRRAVDLVREYCSRYLGKELMSFHVNLDSEEFWDALELGYSVNGGFNGNGAYNTDRIDGFLDKTSFGARTYGHAIRIMKDNAQEGIYNVIVDNYEERNTPNIYRFKRENLKALLSNGVFFRSGYVFVIKDDFEAPRKPEFALWSMASIEKAKAKDWDQWGTPKKPMTPQKLEYILKDLGLLTLIDPSGEGVTEERVAVAFDRAKLLD